MPGKGKPFPKGVSGNPGGRPKVLGDVQKLARQKSPEAINTLSNIMHNEKAPPAARVAAAQRFARSRLRQTNPANLADLS
jgi:hypothetical protein